MNGRDGAELGFGTRDRFRREAQYQSRFDDKSSHNRRSGNPSPPSRHLWVGNLAHGVSEAELTQPFLRFGDLDSVAFQPGRSYAFVNFAREEDAADAFDALQGFPLAGNPLRIEFAKADKSSAQSYDESYSQRRDELRSGTRESPFSQKEYRTRHAGHDQSYYGDNSSMNDKNTEPSPVLWVGFPVSLKVDETVLRRAFSPYGFIEKITAFPGRSYAFVRFESVVSARNARDALHGKLFGNPRVHICFAKNESGSSNTERTTMLGSHQESSEYFRRDRNFSNNPRNSRSPQMFANLDSGDPDPYRQGTLWEQRGFGERGSEYHSPMRGKRGHSQDFPQRFPQTSVFHEEAWNYSDDVRPSHEHKKLKIGSFPAENELPEYPYSDREHETHLFAGNHQDFSQVGPSNRKFDAPYGYKQSISDFPPQREWRDSHESLQLRPGSMNSVKRKRLTPEPHNLSMKEWKWEGIIAKGGTPVCRARCFPVGKALDTTLPEFLDCTARTGLDMLAKHYYQATNAWVVFFVPGSDSDIGFYNEFMHYLEEKQRAAVSKLDEDTTLFLVPPSDFSEKVLKVPGKLSMSGVILRLEQPGPNVVHRLPEHEDANAMSLRGNTSYPNPLPSSHAIPPYFPDHGGGRSDNFDNTRHEYPLHGDLRPVSNWSSSSHPQNPASSHPYEPMVQQHHSSVMTRPMHETTSGYSTGGPTSGIAGLEPEQLAQLASTILGRQRQSVAVSAPIVSAAHDLRHPIAMNETDHVLRTQQSVALQNSQMSSESSNHTQYGQVQLLHRTSDANVNAPAMPQMAQRNNSQMPAEGNQNSATQEVDSDPQNRLQATLQLAAALLQQIQQGKGS